MSSIIRTMCRGNARWTRNSHARGLEHVYNAIQRRKRAAEKEKARLRKEHTARNREQRKRYGSLMFLNQKSNRNA